MSNRSVQLHQTCLADDTVPRCHPRKPRSVRATLGEESYRLRLFLSHNTDLGPPYHVLVDTNFINFSIQNKIELVQGMMDCLMAKCESFV